MLSSYHVVELCYGLRAALRDQKMIIMVFNDHKRLAGLVIEYLFYEVGRRAEQGGGERGGHDFLECTKLQ